MTVLLLSLLLTATWAEQLPVGSEEGVKTTVKTNVIDKARSGCEYPFEPVGNGCYFYSEEKRNFAGAQKACESLGHGYDVTLATFDMDENEDEAILLTATSKDKIFWVGASTEDGENWQWIDERPVYLQAPILYHEEPNASQNKCMVAQVTEYGNFKRTYLFDYGCEDSMNFICQINCPFEFKRIGKFCYFISEEEGVEILPWEEARDYCETLSSPVGYHVDLAVLGLDDQDNYRLMNSLVYDYDISDTWLGAIQEGNCVYNWIDGRSLPSSSHYWIYNGPRCSDHVALVQDTTTNRTYLYDYGAGGAAFICQMFRE